MLSNSNLNETVMSLKSNNIFFFSHLFFHLFVILTALYEAVQFFPDLLLLLFAPPVAGSVTWNCTGTSYPPCGVEMFKCTEKRGDDGLGGGGTKAVAAPG